MATRPQPPSRIAYNFFGSIRTPLTISLRNCLCSAVNDKFEEVTIIFSSDGGSVEDGLALYPFIRSLPIPRLRFHASGQITSISIPVFLAADIRTADPIASNFAFHEYDWTYAQSTTLLESRMEEHLGSLRQAVGRAKTILINRTTFPGGVSEIDGLFKAPRYMNANEAKAVGIVQEIEELRLPADCKIFNVTV
jgi:ATP-dependent Clp protease protease subunit